MASRYDLIIIGAGSAGLTAARFAARLGKRVALIEANRVGGDCTWTGCVPSKALLHAAKAAHTIRNSGLLGLSAGQPEVDFPAVMHRIRKVIEQIYAEESPETLRAEGIEVIEAAGRFRDARTIVAGGREFAAKYFLICTGASPVAPPIPGLAELPYLTYESFWDMKTLPSSMVVIGGGPIGCELAQGCQRLGCQVTLVEAMDRLLPNDEPEAGEVVIQALRRDGVDIRLSTQIRSGDEIRRLGEAVLVAVGRRPILAGLGLDAAGIAYTDRGITVDKYLRTSAKHIYAAGDCAGGFQFTHYAGFQGAMAVRNALLPGRGQGVAELAPWATFTDPEVAHVGYTEGQARLRLGTGVQATTWPMGNVDRAIIEGATDGFIKIVHRPNGKTLGATIVGPWASEATQSWALAAEKGLGLGDVAKTLHIYPSLGTGSQQLAWDGYVSKLTGGLMGRLLRRLSG